MELYEEEFVDFFDSPQIPMLFQRNASASSQGLELPEMTQIAYKQQRQEAPKKVSKLQKNKKIRTSRNVQKTYHNILKNWLQEHKYSTILPKYNEYYNQRVYFILVLNQILKHIDGQSFLQIYQQLSSQVILRKQKDIQYLEQQRHNSQQSLHLKRVIEQIQYSVRACQQFIRGNIMQALAIVYKRNQEKITKKKQFQRAIHIFEEVTGMSRNYF